MGDGLVEVRGLTPCASRVTAGVGSRRQDEGRRSSPEQGKGSIPKQIFSSATETTAGSAGQERMPAQYAAEFDGVENAWRQFRELACRAAFHQFDGGTGASGFQIPCEPKLTRDLVFELDLIDGSDLHL